MIYRKGSLASTTAANTAGIFGVCAVAHLLFSKKEPLIQEVSKKNEPSST